MRFGPSEESLASWATNAAFWDERQGDEGSRWQREAVAPAVERLLALRRGEHVLELCCGNGALARRLARTGAQVVASDGVAELVERAKSRSRGDQARVTWRVADATSEDQIARLGPGPFDAAVCSMAVMDIPDVAPLFRGVRGLVGPRARFVVAMTHPCFETSGGELFEDRQVGDDGAAHVVRGVKVTGYLQPFRWMCVAIEGQPALQPCYHRPLSAIVVDAVAAGWVLDGLEELPAPPDGSPKRRLGWSEVPEVPPILVLRFAPR